MKRSKVIFVMSDTHFGMGNNGGHDEPAFATALKAMEIIRPDEFIHIGDIGEWESCSSWEFKKKKRPPIDYLLPALDLEVIEVNKQMDRIDAVLDAAGTRKRMLIEGNHEIWVHDMLADSALTQQHYDLRSQLRLRERGWKMMEFGEYYQRGKLRFYHGGHYMTVNHARNHALNCGASVMYGHVHDLQCATVGSLEGPHGAWSIGCLCHLKKKFLKGRQTNWQHGFAVVYLQPNGNFNVQLTRIEDGWTIVNGREIHAGKLIGGRPRKEIV